MGTAARLRPLVRVLGSEMAAAFTAAGAVTPPWRTPASLLSKWLPKVCKDRSGGGVRWDTAASLLLLLSPESKYTCHGLLNHEISYAAVMDT